MRKFLMILLIVLMSGCTTKEDRLKQPALETIFVDKLCQGEPMPKITGVGSGSSMMWYTQYINTDGDIVLITLYYDGTFNFKMVYPGDFCESHK